MGTPNEVGRSNPRSPVTGDWAAIRRRIRAPGSRRANDARPSVPPTKAQKCGDAVPGATFFTEVATGHAGSLRCDQFAELQLPDHFDHQCQQHFLLVVREPFDDRSETGWPFPGDQSPLAVAFSAIARPSEASACLRNRTWFPGWSRHRWPWPFARRYAPRRRSDAHLQGRLATNRRMSAWVGDNPADAAACQSSCRATAASRVRPSAKRRSNGSVISSNCIGRNPNQMARFVKANCKQAMRARCGLDCFAEPVDTETCCRRSVQRSANDHPASQAVLEILVWVMSRQSRYFPPSICASTGWSSIIQRSNGHRGRRLGTPRPPCSLGSGVRSPVGMYEVVWISIQSCPYACQCARRLDRLSGQRGGFCHLADQNVQIGIGLWWQTAMRHHECNGGIDFIGQDLSR